MIRFTEDQDYTPPLEIQTDCLLVLYENCHENNCTRRVQNHDDVVLTRSESIDRSISHLEEYLESHGQIEDGDIAGRIFADEDENYWFLKYGASIDEKIKLHKPDGAVA